MISEIPALVALAVPIVAGLLGSTVLGVIDSFMLGPLGEVPLAVASLTQSVLVIFYAGLYGLAGAVGVYVGQAQGGNNPVLAGGVLRQGLVMGLLSGIVAALAMMAAGAYVLPHAGQPAEVLAQTPRYWMAMSALLVPFAMQMAFKLFLDSIERPWTGAVLTLLPIAFNIPLNWLLIYGNLGFPKLGLLGAGLASLISVSAGFLIMLFYLGFANSMQPYRNAVKLGEVHFGKLTREGMPMSLQYLAEGGSVAVAGVLMGLLGATALAANQIVFSVGALIYMAPLGLASAVMIRIAQAFGEGTAHRIRAIGLAGLFVVTSWMMVFTAIMVLWGEPMARAFVSDPPVIAAATAMFAAVGIMQIFDGLQSVGLGALRGMLDTRWPTLVSLVSYWLIALPLSVLFGFTLGYGGPGIWAGFGTGLAFAAVLVVARFLSRTKRITH